jgi:hypothetical protein
MGKVTVKGLDGKSKLLTVSEDVEAQILVQKELSEIQNELVENLTKEIVYLKMTMGRIK